MKGGKKIPNYVKNAIVSGNISALHFMGRKGGQASAEARRRRKEIEEDAQERWEQIRKVEIESLLQETNEITNPID